MTVLLDEAIREFAASYGTQSPLEDMQILQKVDQETWEEICEYRRSLDEWEYKKCLRELETIKKWKSGISQIKRVILVAPFADPEHGRFGK